MVVEDQSDVHLSTDYLRLLVRVVHAPTCRKHKLLGVFNSVKMKVSNSQVSRITKDVSTVVEDNNGKQYTMCCEIINGELDLDSVGVTYYESKEFDKLSEVEAQSFKLAAFNEFKRFR